MKISRWTLRLVLLIGCLGNLQLMDGLLYANGYLWYHRPPNEKTPPKNPQPPDDIPTPPSNPKPPAFWPEDPIIDDNGDPKYGELFEAQLKNQLTFIHCHISSEKMDGKWEEDTIGNWEVWYDGSNLKMECLELDLDLSTWNLDTLIKTLKDPSESLIHLSHYYSRE